MVHRVPDMNMRSTSHHNDARSLKMFSWFSTGKHQLENFDDPSKSGIKYKLFVNTSRVTNHKPKPLVFLIELGEVGEVGKIIQIMFVEFLLF